MLPNEIIKHIADVDLDSCKAISYLGKAWEDYYEKQKFVAFSNTNLMDEYFSNNIDKFELYLRHFTEENKKNIDENTLESIFSSIFSRHVKWLSALAKYVPICFTRFNIATFCQEGSIPVFQAGQPHVRILKSIRCEMESKLDACFFAGCYSYCYCNILKFIMKRATNFELNMDAILSNLECYSEESYITHVKQTLCILIENGYNINTRYEFKKTLLHIAAENGLVQTVSFLLQLGINKFLYLSANNVDLTALGLTSQLLKNSSKYPQTKRRIQKQEAFQQIIQLLK